ncbi:hypothetical protein [Streptomyces tendae]|uniref:hypothetical protein n=1 Tax=Streptomyces tendae TaxID=1932 RepID=UPI00368F8C8E
MTEGMANNPILRDLFNDLTWADKPLGFRKWVYEWAASAYGLPTYRADEAWQILMATAYGPWRQAHQEALPAETVQALGSVPVDASNVHGAPAVAATLFELADAMSEALPLYACSDSVIAARPESHG